MQLRTAFALAMVAFAGCVPGTPVYLGGAFATVQGHVFALEDHNAISGAEVCLLGADTTCTRTDTEGSYKLFTTSSMVIDISFRIAGTRPARIDSVLVAPPDVYVFDCTMSTIVTLSTEPGSCREGRSDHR